ncbi:alpha/beta hydrolase [Candidatus Peribacteria bacterium]|nr:alpha/beta hydrolase [Candidatus Peribacteria bacterium]
MKHVLVCLHGWGGSKESFTELRAALKEEPIEILTPDLPGFGSEPEPMGPWTVDEYADWVDAWIMKQIENGKLKMENSIHLLGHSHGGRIALKLAYRQSAQSSKLMSHSFSITHLYLCAAAGLRHPRHIKRIIGLTLSKTGKFFFALPGLSLLAPLGKKILYKLVRVHDYEKASAVMRQTLIKVSAEDLRPILKDIHIATDIFWGKDDRMTPFSDALTMKRDIRGSYLHAYEGVRHAVHRDKAEDIAAIIHARMNLS